MASWQSKLACLEKIAQTYTLALAVGWSRSWRDSGNPELQQPLLDVQERRISQNLSITYYCESHIFWSTVFLSPHMHTEQGKAALRTQLCYLMQCLQECLSRSEVYRALLSHQLWQKEPKFGSWFSLFHTIYYLQKSLTCDLCSNM